MRSGRKIQDVTGRTFGRLTALYPTTGRSPKGYVLWHCRCACGNELDVSYNNLMYSTQKSCGCQRREHRQALGQFLTHIDGTSVEMLKSRKLSAGNSTGFRGVYLIRGKYVAKLVFQRKAYYLGTYTDIDDAIQARRRAENAVFTQAAIFYDAWKAKAEHDPQWAEENPATVTVKRDQNDQLYLETWPCL